jgi:hypothetical protein
MSTTRLANASSTGAQDVIKREAGAGIYRRLSALEVVARQMPRVVTNLTIFFLVEIFIRDCCMLVYSLNLTSGYGHLSLLLKNIQKDSPLCRQCFSRKWWTGK